MLAGPAAVYVFSTGELLSPDAIADRVPGADEASRQCHLYIRASFAPTEYFYSRGPLV